MLAHADGVAAPSASPTTDSSIHMEEVPVPENKTAYVAMSSDILHKGHLKVINAAAELGEVTIGLLTDESIATYKRLPILDWESRKAVLESLTNVSRVVPQESLSYAANLRELRPDYVVHGDDWRSGIQSMVRDDKQRAMLYDLDRTIQSLKTRFGDGEEVLSLLNMYHNLLRQWTEV